MLKNTVTAQPAKRKLATKLGMFSSSHERVIVPMGRDRKYRPHSEPIRLQAFVQSPLRKFEVFFGRQNIYNMLPQLAVMSQSD